MLIVNIQKLPAPTSNFPIFKEWVSLLKYPKAITIINGLEKRVFLNKCIYFNRKILHKPTLALAVGSMNEDFYK